VSNCLNFKKYPAPLGCFVSIYLMHYGGNFRGFTQSFQAYARALRYHILWVVSYTSFAVSDRPNVRGYINYAVEIVSLNKLRVQSFLKSWQSLSFSRSNTLFIESEGSLPCSQQPATGPYLESDASSAPPFPPYFRKIHSNVIPPSASVSPE
jgi:hypothetical protein